MNPSIAKINHLITWILASTFYAFQMTLRVIPVLMLYHLTYKVGFNASQLGLLTGIYYIGYCIAHIPIGLMLDRVQPRYIIAGCLLICVAGLYIKMFASSTFDIFLARFLIGFGSAAGILGSVKVVCDFYRPTFGIMLGLTISIGILGAYYGAEPIRMLLASLSYEQVIEGLILFGIMLAASIVAFYGRSVTTTETSPMLTTLRNAFKNKKLLYIGLCTGLMVGPLEGFADLWGMNYLVQIHHLTATEATYSISLIFIGLGIGCPTFGYLSNRIDSYTKVIAYIGILMLITITTLFYASGLNLSMIYIACFVIGVLSSYQILSFVIVQKMESATNISISIALLNMMIMVFGFIYHSLIGFILDTFFISSTVNTLIYGVDAYQAAFSVILVGIIIGAVGFWRIKDF
jgi:MFS family permease